MYLTFFFFKSIHDKIQYNKSNQHHSTNTITQYSNLITVSSFIQGLGGWGHTTLNISTNTKLFHL